MIACKIEGHKGTIKQKVGTGYHALKSSDHLSNMAALRDCLPESAIKDIIMVAGYI